MSFLKQQLMISSNEENSSGRKVRTGGGSGKSITPLLVTGGLRPTPTRANTCTCTKNTKTETDRTWAGWGAPPINKVIEVKPVKSTCHSGLNGSDSKKGFFSGGFFKDLNLNEIIKTGATTWSNIEAAKSGKAVYVQQPNGTKQDIAPLLISKLEAQAAQQQTSVDNMMQMMKMQLEAQNKPKETKDNTLIYIASASGIVLLLGGAYLITKKK